MNKQILKYSSAVALLMNVSSASTVHRVYDKPSGEGGPAPCLKEYMMVASDVSTVGWDPHALTGVQTQDGNFVVVGSGKQSDPETGEDHGNSGVGFITKFTTGCQSYKYSLQNGKGLPGPSTCKDYAWTTTLNNRDKMTIVVNLAESPDGKFLIAVGVQQTSSNYTDLAVWKINSADGAIVWTMNYKEGKQDGTELIEGSGAETIQFAPDGGVILGGFVAGAGLAADTRFKSGGGTSGDPIIAKLSAQDIAGSSAPKNFEWIYKDENKKGSFMSLKISPENGWVVAINGDITVLDTNGELVMNSTKQGDKTVDAKDLVLTEDGGVILAGLVWFTTQNGNKGIKGGLQKWDADLNVQWTKVYGNYPGGTNQFEGLPTGSWDLIKTECWGMTKTYDEANVVDGYAMACGGGIEGCDPWIGTDMEETCDQDPRTTWRALNIKVDLEGNRVWSRQDSFQDPGRNTNAKQAVRDSASEFIISAAGGMLAFVGDEADGYSIGIFDNNGAECTETLESVLYNSPENIAIRAEAAAGEGVSAAQTMSKSELSQLMTQSSQALAQINEGHKQKIQKIRAMIDDLMEEL